MANIFVSIVGTQIMGTAHPRSVFLKSNPNGKTILLATSKTMESALRLKQEAENSSEGEVYILSIPMTTGCPDSASAVCVKIAEKAKAEGVRMFFNVDGGMNYLIADCVMALAPYDAVLLQSSEMRTLAFDTKSGLVERLPDAELLSVQSIFALQGVQWERAQNAGELAQFCKRGNIQLPASCEENVVIDGQHFDFVWTSGGNRLYFMKDLRRLPGDSKERLSIERALTHWATDRTRSAQLYDRKVYAIVQDEKSAYRLFTESCGKIEAFNVAGWWDDASKLREPLIKVFGRQAATKEHAEQLKAPAQTKEAPLEDGTLIVSVGTNIVPTLVALRSHKPRHAVLCCSKQLEGHAERIRDAAAEFDLESVRIVRVAVEGSYLEKLLPALADGAKVSINITPGTKGHGAMLAYWGYKHGCSVWSIDNRNGLCTPLYAPHEEQPIEAVPCDMETRFRVEGVELLQPGDFPHDELELYRGLLEFMRASIAERKDKDVFQKDVSAGGKTLKCVSRGQRLWSFESGESSYTLDLNNGEWVEKLAAVALDEAGFSDVRYRVQFRWPEEVEKKIKKKYDSGWQSLDLDTIGSRKNHIVVISCKSFGNNKAVAATEIASTGERLGRFALRMLLHLGVDEPDIHEGKVMVFGWRTLCQKTEFLNLVDNLHSFLRTTEE